MQRLIRVAQDQLNLTLTPAHTEAFQVYADELMAWNARTNLTAITDPADIEIRHFADSLTCLKVLKPRSPGLRLIDIGTGAGFPGLPLKIVCPQLDVTLVELKQKKIDFLNHVIDLLGLEGITTLHSRAESLGQIDAHRESYDWVLARAVAGMNILAEYMLPLAKIGGRCLPQKGESAAQEVNESHAIIELLGGQVMQLIPIELPTVVDTHYLIDIKNSDYTAKIPAPSRHAQ